ncbi:hypothetical protein RHAA1_09571 [Aggregatibacter actinomycetemcomitans RhAA1]|nr:hypothetical protein RHAA1_09571 [Aggregatibacter actinomycetemcomitans RhAA1]
MLFWVGISGFADGEFLFFASPKKRNQKKGDPDKSLFPFSKYFS